MLGITNVRKIPKRWSATGKKGLNSVSGASVSSFFFFLHSMRSLSEMLKGYRNSRQQKHQGTVPPHQIYGWFSQRTCRLWAEADLVSKLAGVMLKGGRVPAHAVLGSIGELTYQISSKEVCIKSMALGAARVRKHLLWWHLSKRACVGVCVCGPHSPTVSTDTEYNWLCATQWPHG